nr:hypothetical protein [Tanacetum cinerariifolium]
MVNTRTDADLSAAVQNALQTLLPQIRVEIREEFRTSSGPSDAGGNPPPVTIHTWLERFNKQKPPAGTEEEQAKNFQWGLRRNSDNRRDQRIRGQQSNRYANSSFQQSKGPSEGYSYPVCTTCGRRHPGDTAARRGTCFKCGQVGHLQKDCKKNTTARTSGQADKKPGASGRVFAITEDHATKTS